MKNKLIKLTSLIICALMLLSLVSCNKEEAPATDKPTDAITDKPTEEPTDAPTDAPTDKPTEKPTEAPKDDEDDEDDGLIPAPAPLSPKKYDLSKENDKIRLLGRAKVTADGTTVDHSAAGIEFQAFMSGELTVTVSSDEVAFFTVYIDGKRLEERFEVRYGEKTLTLASFEGNYLHTVRLLKETESMNALSTFSEIRMTGYIVDAPDERDFFIEFIGDSLTCGYGNLGDSSSTAPGGPLWQNATQAYAFIASEKLGAEASIIACSGMGVDEGWRDYEAEEFYSALSYHRNTAEKFEFDKRPDLVVIHLGANDYALDAPKSSFIASCKSLIKCVRDGYESDVPIIWAYEPKEAEPEWLKEMIDSLGGESAELYMLALSQNTAGANGHPTVDSHVEAADTLCDFIRSKQILDID